MTQLHGSCRIMMALLTGAFIAVCASCKTSQTTKSKKEASEGFSLSNFAWNPESLPACIGARERHQVFVWSVQKTFKCENGAWN